MQNITTAMEAASALFSVVVVLCVLVTGFYVGRAWLRRVGYDGDGASKENLEGFENPDGSGEAWYTAGGETKHYTWSKPEDRPF